MKQNDSRFQFVVSLLQGRNSMAEGHAGGGKGAHPMEARKQSKKRGAGDKNMSFQGMWQVLHLQPGPPPESKAATDLPMD